jgi:hypothetical protein
MQSSVRNNINARYSCRTYLPQPLGDSLRAEVEEYLRTLTAGPFGSPVRVVLAAATADDPANLKKLGTYGFIKGATGFLVGAVGRGSRDLEDYGHVVEQAILHLTGLGLGSCWLGGSFTRTTFAKRLGGVRVGESMPAVVSVGFPGDDGTDRIRQRETGSRRLPPASLFFDGAFGQPLSLRELGPFAGILEGVRMAPSASNKQPWRIVRSGGDWHFYVQRVKGYGKGSALYRLLRLADLQRVDLGIAMCHFALLAEEAGLAGRLLVDETRRGPLPTGAEYVATWRGGVS